MISWGLRTLLDQAAAFSAREGPSFGRGTSYKRRADHLLQLSRKPAVPALRAHADSLSRYESYGGCVELVESRWRVAVQAPELASVDHAALWNASVSVSGSAVESEKTVP